jgi:hypothetical protein
MIIVGDEWLVVLLILLRAHHSGRSSWWSSTKMFYFKFGNVDLTRKRAKINPPTVSAKRLRLSVLKKFTYL